MKKRGWAKRSEMRERITWRNEYIRRFYVLTLNL